MNTTTFTYSGFEGPEKLLEIWFSSSIDASLRSVEPAVWQDMLQVVQCKILSVLNNEHADAYLLSESSMFVYSNRLILKTCGTTTLLNSLPLIIKIAADIGLCTVDHLFYSRKSFLFPDLQEFPHGQWSDEVGYLDAIFLPHLYDTSAYVLGKTNHDHWFLYKSSRADLDSDGNSLDTAASIEAEANDFTLEILMTELNQDAMKCFWRNESELQQAKLPQNENALKHTFLDPKRLYVCFDLLRSNLDYPKYIQVH
jgi:S-adenosylmethionine decarboxylase